MKLRTILLMLALLAFLSTSTGGYLYYSSLKASVFQETEAHAYSDIQNLAQLVSSYLAQNLNTVKALAAHEEFRQLLVRADETAQAKENKILDLYRESQGTIVCYVMDHHGDTVASSNRNDPDSFVGKNYNFRPYFQKAVQGTPYVFMALGVTSQKRGVYFSHPVYAENNAEPIGVAVIKASIVPLEQKISMLYGGTVLLTDPHGIIFATNRKDWLLHTTWKVTTEVMADIAASRQFGPGPWKWTGLKMSTADYAVDRSGAKYLVYQTEVVNHLGWKLVYLVDFDKISQTVFDPLIKTSTGIILVLCVLIGLAVFFLYRLASHDITKRKAAEDALISSEKKICQLNQKLEQRVKERTAELERAYNELKKVAYVISHDLKSSLRGINQLAGWIEQDYADAFDDSGRRQMQLLNSRVKRTYGFVDGLWEYLKLEGPRIKGETVCFDKLLENVIADLALPDHIQVTVPSDLPVIEGKNELFRQIFINLIGNATKFADKDNGQIKVECVEENEHWQFSVADNGPGIEEKYHEKIFRIFQTLKSRDELESTGIGLTLTKKIVDLYGGKIWVESEPGKGSTFFFTLPKQRSAG